VNAHEMIQLLVSASQLAPLATRSLALRLAPATFLAA
jgi:hypothetical protein